MFSMVVAMCMWTWVCRLRHRRPNWGLGVATPRFLAGISGGLWGIVDRSWNIIIILSCAGSMFKSDDFSSEIESFAQNLAVHGKFCLDKRKFWSKWLKQGHSEGFVWKKFFLKYSIFLPGSTTPRFQAMQIDAAGLCRGKIYVGIVQHHVELPFNMN